MDARALIEQDRFAARAGVSVLEVREGFARARLAVGPDHLNALGTVQGGAIFTLADTAFAAASNSHGTAAVTVDASISFIKATSHGALIAEAREEALSARLSTCTVRVTDDQGELVALLKGTAFRKRQAAEVMPSATTV